MAYIYVSTSMTFDLDTTSNTTRRGFALQFVEMQEQIASSGALKNSCALTGTCAAWDAYALADGIVVEDSGV
jgi:hypothetical protein